MRVLVLYTRLSGYMAGCLRAFRERTGADLLVYAWPGDPNAPFDASMTAAVGDVRSRRSLASSDMLRVAEDFRPDAVLVSGWRDAGYVAVCRAIRSSGVPVISGCDTQWTGSLRQKAASITAPLYVQKFIDVLWVTGDRQRRLAAALGYRGHRCWDGFYACDVDGFAAAATARESGSPPPAFLFVGRYVPEKGIHTLVAAYSAYRTRVADPWRLVCAGAGPLRERLVACGAEDAGFTQPTSLPLLMARATAFVLPSIFEPWGVVLQEAAAAGLPLIASHACGASVHLLRSGFNGFGFEAGDAAGLTEALIAMHGCSATDRAAMGNASSHLARQYTPAIWAATLDRGISMLRKSQRGPDGGRP